MWLLWLQFLLVLQFIVSQRIHMGFLTLLWKMLRL